MAQWGVLKLSGGREITFEWNHVTDDGCLEADEVAVIAQHLWDKARKEGVKEADLANSRFVIAEADFFWRRMEFQSGRGASLPLLGRFHLLDEWLLKFRF